MGAIAVALHVTELGMLVVGKEQRRTIGAYSWLLLDRPTTYVTTQHKPVVFIVCQRMKK